MSIKTILIAQTKKGYAAIENNEVFDLWRSLSFEEIFIEIQSRYPEYRIKLIKCLTMSFKDLITMLSELKSMVYDRENSINRLNKVASIKTMFDSNVSMISKSIKKQLQESRSNFQKKAEEISKTVISKPSNIASYREPFKRLGGRTRRYSKRVFKTSYVPPKEVARSLMLLIATMQGCMVADGLFSKEDSTK